MDASRVDLANPEWLAHRFDEQADAIRFVQVSRPDRARLAFLGEKDLADRPVLTAPRDGLPTAFASARLGYIFHSAYCCSTLLANALDIRGAASALKEPQILNDMVGWRHRGAAPAAVGQMLDHSLHLLARPFEPGETVIIKPSNVVNGLASAMLSLRSDARAILLYAPLRSFVTSIARKGMWGRMWVRELLSRQLVDGLVDLGFEPRDYLLHTDLQAAAVGWLAQQQLFAALQAKWPERIRTLNSETLVARPTEAMRAACDLFGLSVENEQVAAIVAESFSRDAKSGATFTQGQREAERLAGEAVHAEEIDKVVIWAEAVAANVGMTLDLGGALM